MRLDHMCAGLVALLFLLGCGDRESAEQAGAEPEAPLARAGSGESPAGDVPLPSSESAYAAKLDRDYIVHLAESGDVRLGWDDDADKRFPFGARTREEQATALAGLESALRALVRNPLYQRMDGTSMLTLSVEAEARAKWQHVQWIMQTFVAPSVRVSLIRMRVKNDKEWFGAPLPLDSGLSNEEFIAGHQTAKRRPKKLTVKVFRKEKATANAFTKVRIDRTHTFQFPPRSMPGDEAFEKVRVQIQDLVRMKSETGEIERFEMAAMPPDGGAVPAGHVLALCRLMRSVGDTPLVFEAAAPPLMRRR